MSATRKYRLDLADHEYDCTGKCAGLMVCDECGDEFVVCVGCGCQKIITGVNQMYEIKNSFHNTKTRTKYSPEERESIAARVWEGSATDAEKSAMRRAAKKLCPVKGCLCAGPWGERK